MWGRVNGVARPGFGPLPILPHPLRLRQAPNGASKNGKTAADRMSIRCRETLLIDDLMTDQALDLVTGVLFDLGPELRLEDDQDKSADGDQGHHLNRFHAVFVVVQVEQVAEKIRFHVITFVLFVVVDRFCIKYRPPASLFRLAAFFSAAAQIKRQVAGLSTCRFLCSCLKKAVIPGRP